MKPANSGRRDSLFLFACFCLTAAGVWLRLSVVDATGLWLDEIWSANAAAAERSSGEVIAAAAKDFHPPVYDLLLHGWLRWSGLAADTAGRWLSVIFGLAGIAASGFYARRAGGSARAGLLGLVLAAMSFFLISYSVEERYYALVYLLALGLIGQLLGYLRERRLLQLALAGLFGLLLVFTHLFGVFLMLALGLGLLLLRMGRHISGRVLLSCLGVFALCGILFALWLVPVLRQGEVQSWAKMPGAAAFFEYLYDYTAKNPLEAAFLLLPLLLGYRLRGPQRPVWILLTTAILGTYLLALAVSAVKTPLLQQRYTMAYFPAFVLLAAVFWSSGRLLTARREKIAAVAVGLSCLLNLLLLGGGLRGRLRDEPWRRAAQALRGNNLPVLAENAYYLNYYLRYYRLPEALVPGDTPPAAPFWYFISSHDDPGRLEKAKAVPADSVIDLGSDFYLRRCR